MERNWHHQSMKALTLWLWLDNMGPWLLEELFLWAPFLPRNLFWFSDCCTAGDLCAAWSRFLSIIQLEISEIMKTQSWLLYAPSFSKGIVSGEIPFWEMQKMRGDFPGSFWEKTAFPVSLCPFQKLVGSLQFIRCPRNVWTLFFFFFLFVMSYPYSPF